MGDTYTYKCQKCGYEQDFNQGHGFLVHPQPVSDYLNLKTQLFHYKTHQKIVALAKVHSNLQIKATFQVYMCPKCHLLFDKAEVRIFEGKKLFHKSRFRCSNCDGPIKLTNIHRLSKATCPACNKKTFTLDHTRHNLWD
jgi:Zn finger protein HypA/HybF involved in hydrogenase expression